MPAEVISVIIAFKNGNIGHLDAAVKSAIAQNCDEEVEVIICDDGSSPSISSALGQYVDRLSVDGSTKVILERNRGVPGISDTRNTACAMAKGRWLYFLDADDLVPVGAFRSLRRVDRSRVAKLVVGQCLVRSRDASDQTIDALHTNSVYWREWARLSKRSTVDNPLLQVVFPVHGGLMHADLFAKLSGFDPAFRYGELTDLVLRAALMMSPDDIRVACESTYVWHRHEGSHSSARIELNSYRMRAIWQHCEALAVSIGGISYAGHDQNTGSRRYHLLDWDGQIIPTRWSQFDVNTEFAANGPTPSMSR